MLPVRRPDLGTLLPTWEGTVLPTCMLLTVAGSNANGAPWLTSSPVRTNHTYPSNQKGRGKQCAASCHPPLRMEAYIVKNLEMGHFH